MSNGLDPFERASLIVAHDESNAFDAVVPPDRPDLALHLQGL